MKTISILLFLLLSIQLSFALDKIYLIELNYENSKFSLKDIKVTDGFYRGKDYNNNSGYNIKVLRNDNAILWENGLNIEHVLFFENETGSHIILLNSLNISDALPYFNEAKFIKIYYNGNEVFSIDVTKFSNYCGNGICNSGEESSCLEDCKGQQSLFKRFNFRYIIAIILILIVFLFLFSKLRKRKTELPKKEETQKITQQIKQQPKKVDEKAALLEALKRIKEKRKF